MANNLRLDYNFFLLDFLDFSPTSSIRHESGCHGVAFAGDDGNIEIISVFVWIYNN